MTRNTTFPIRSLLFFVILIGAGIAVSIASQKEPAEAPIPTESTSSFQVVYSVTFGSAPTPTATIVTYTGEGTVKSQTKNLSTNRFTETTETTLTDTDQTAFEALVTEANVFRFKNSYRCDTCGEDLPTERLTFYLATGNKTIELYQPDEIDLPLELAAILEQMRTWGNEARIMNNE